MALFVSEPRDVALSLRITRTVSERLDKALEAELKDPRNRSLTKTELGARLVELGLHVYSAMESHSGEEARKIAALTGNDQLKAMAEVVKRGLESLESESGKKKGGR